MSSKKSKSKRSSVAHTIASCNDCEMSFNKEDELKHKFLCGSSITDGIEIPLNSLHGFIYKKRFVAPIFSTKVDTKNVSTFYSTRLAHLNPKTMQVLAVSPAWPIFVTFDNDKIETLIAWANESIPFLQVGFGRRTDSSVCIIDRVPRINVASEIKLQSVDDSKLFTSNQEFHEFLRMHLTQIYLHLTEEILIRYFGQTVFMSVMDVRGTNCLNSEVAMDEELTNAINGLQLDETSANDSAMGDELNSSCDRINSPKKAVETSVRLYFPSGKSISEAFLITESTKVTVNPLTFDKSKRITFDDIGGLKLAKREIELLLLNPLRHRAHPTTILLHGIPGVGKTMLLKALLNATDASVFELNELAIDNLMQFFDAAASKCALLIIDDIDRFLGGKDKDAVEFKRSSILSKLCQCFDDYSERIFVAAATSRLDAIPPQLRRRFHFEIEVSAPSVNDRREILEKFINAMNLRVECPSEIANAVASKSHGFTGSDLAILCKYSLCLALEEKSSTIDSRIFTSSLSRIRPSAMKEIVLDIPRIRWNDIGGQADVKLKLQQAVEWPLKHPETFARLGIRPPAGVLLYGPPGCSKTMIAQALATESGLNFLAVKGPELFSKWVGESERAIREIFRKARQAAPAIIFFDEIDAIAVKRSRDSSGSGVGDRVLTQLLTELDGIEALVNICVIAATNRPEIIDPALLRPGRLDRIIYVTLPDSNARRDVIQIRFRNMKIEDEVKNGIDELVNMSEGYSGAELVAVCNEAALFAMQENINISAVAWRHFKQSFATVRPRTTQEMLKSFQKFSTLSHE